jgi:DNA-binding transcriptional MerR regulator
MGYTVKKLAGLAGVSVRTLRYYDKIGLLKPGSYSAGGYRLYGETEFFRLQQILFYRELDFSLSEINEIINQPDFNIIQALSMHKKLLHEKIVRLNSLIKTIDKTVSSLKGEYKMEDKEYYGGFSKEQQKRYRQEIREKYGSQALDESDHRMRGWAKEDYQRSQEEGDKIFTAIRDNMDRGYDSLEVQTQIEALHNWVNRFYTCNLEMLEGLGHLYNDHPDFVKMWKTKYHEKMPGFLLKAIEYYCRSKMK